MASPIWPCPLCFVSLLCVMYCSSRTGVITAIRGVTSISGEPQGVNEAERERRKGGGGKGEKICIEEGRGEGRERCGSVLSISEKEERESEGGPICCLSKTQRQHVRKCATCIINHTEKIYLTAHLAIHLSFFISLPPSLSLFSHTPPPPPLHLHSPSIKHESSYSPPKFMWAPSAPTPHTHIHTQLCESALCHVCVRLPPHHHCYIPHSCLGHSGVPSTFS